MNKLISKSLDFFISPNKTGICLLTILTVHSFSPSFGYDCLRIKNLKKAQKEEFLFNDLIFIGRATSINPDGSYELEVIEILKGTLADSTVIGGAHGNYQGIIPFEIGETWLIYTIKNQDGTITIADCGLSRSSRFPIYFGSPHVPPPPPPLEYSLPIFELEIIWLRRQKRALEELQQEVERIRKWVKRDKYV